MAELQAAQAAAQPQPAQATFECKMEDLPTTVPEPNAEQWTQYYNLWSALDALARQELVAGIQVPVNFVQLQAGTDVPRQLLGETIWRLAFPTDPGPDTVLTHQVRQLLTYALKIHQSKLLTDKSRQEEAARAVTVKIDEAVTEYRAKRPE